MVLLMDQMTKHQSSGYPDVPCLQFQINPGSHFPGNPAVVVAVEPAAAAVHAVDLAAASSARRVNAASHGQFLPYSNPEKNQKVKTSYNSYKLWYMIFPDFLGVIITIYPFRDGFSRERCGFRTATKSPKIRGFGLRLYLWQHCRRNQRPWYPQLRKNPALGQLWDKPILICNYMILYVHLWIYASRLAFDFQCCWYLCDFCQEG